MFNKVMTLPSKKDSLITFYISASGEDPSGFKAESGMTWADWVSSQYYAPLETIYGTDYIQINQYGRVCSTNYSGMTTGVHANNHGTKDSDVIIDGQQYTLWCYARNTLVTLADGSVKAVQDLAYDDELLVWDFDNGCFATAKALWITKARVADHYYRLKFDDGTELCLVGSDGKCHRLMNIENGEFTYGSHFHVGQHTFKEDGSNPRLVSIELVEEEVEYYNVATHYHMNCFVNGILSSTGYNNMYLIKDMKFVKDNREFIPFEDYVDVPRQFYDSLRLGEQDLSKRSIEKAKNYVGRMLKAMK